LRLRAFASKGFVVLSFGQSILILSKKQAIFAASLKAMPAKELRRTMAA